MPLMFAPTKARSRARQPKISDEQRKLDSAHQLTVAQYQKLRYKYPEEVLRSATPDGTSENVDAKEMVLLRLNVDAFAVHFRHEACVNFVSAAHGENVATVCFPALYPDGTLLWHRVTCRVHRDAGGTSYDGPDKRQ